MWKLTLGYGTLYNGSKPNILALVANSINRSRSLLLVEPRVWGFTAHVTCSIVLKKWLEHWPCVHSSNLVPLLCGFSFTSSLWANGSNHKHCGSNYIPFQTCQTFEKIIFKLCSKNYETKNFFMSVKFPFGSGLRL
jgi:hypothetical protein